MAQRVEHPSSATDDGALVADASPRALRWLGLGPGRARQRGDRDSVYIPEGLGPPATVRRDAHFRRALVSADLLSVALSGIVAVALLGDDRLLPAAVLLLPLVVA